MFNLFALILIISLTHLMVEVSIINLSGPSQASKSFKFSGLLIGLVCKHDL